MSYSLLADLVVLAHFAFVVFVVLGGLLVIRWGWFALLHLPCAVWAMLLEFFGWICPLTPLENRLRRQAGETGYDQGFVEEYLLPVLYPESLTVSTQYVLGAAVLLITLCVYAIAWRAFRRRQAEARSTSSAS